MTRRALAFPFLALGALYLAIWPHELGHSVAAFVFGCKADWWRTDVSWYLWSSWGGPIDYECLAARGRLALGVTDFAGIGVNLALLALAPMAGRWSRAGAQGATTSWVFLATFCIALANYAEAFSYLVVNTAWLSSDMVNVVEASGLSRWVWLAFGIALAGAAARILRPAARRGAMALAATPGAMRAWQILFVLYVAATAAGMAAARLVLT